MTKPDEMGISKEDQDLFRKMVGEITPVKHAETQALVSPHAKIQHKPREERFLSDSYHTTVQPETPLFYSRAPLSRAQNLAFKRGQLPIHAALDLHGMTAHEAKQALIDFIHQHHRAGHRNLLVIHGKGRHSTTSTLKTLVNHWLPQCPEVLAFVSAKPKDGGHGAVYVLLSRCKS